MSRLSLSRSDLSRRPFGARGMILFWTLVVIVIAGLMLLGTLAYVKKSQRPPELEVRPIVPQSGSVMFYVRTREGKIVKGHSVDASVSNGDTVFSVTYDPKTKLFIARDVFTSDQLEATIVHGENVTKKIIDINEISTIVLSDYYNNVVLVNGSLRIKKDKLQFELKNLGQGEYRAQSGVLFWDNSSLALKRIRSDEEVLWDAKRDHQGVPVYSGMTVPFKKDFKLEKDGEKEKIEFTFTRKVKGISAVTLKLFSDYDVDQLIAVTVD